MKFEVRHLLSKCMLLLLMVGASTFALAQTVSGTVTDASTGEALIGANVLIKGTDVGATTNIDGKYTVNVPEGGTTLVFSYTGYSAQEVAIDGRTTVDVTLREGIDVNELVVVGYGEVKKSDITGAVSSVKAEDFNKGVLTAPDQLIQGKVAGVQVINNSGQPGGGTTVRIRGNSSIRSGNQPLYVVDGVPLDGRSARPGGNGSGIGASTPTNPLNFINPADIASMEVLKDASAAAIYGARGANGVVIITTKKGRSGDPTIDFGVSVGTSSILKKYDVLTGDEYRSALTDYGLTSGDGGGSVDAMDEILQNGLNQNYNFSIGGGSENGNYRVSASYLNQDGIIKESNFKKYTGSIVGNYKFLDGMVGLDYNLSAAQIDEALAPISTDAGFQGSLIGQALQWNPTIPLMTDGEFTTIDNNSLVGNTTINPLQALAAFDDNSNLVNILGSISPYVKLADGLTYRFLYSVNRQVGERRNSVKSFINIDGLRDEGLAAIQNESLLTTQYTHTLSYVKPIAEGIDLNAVVGYEYQSFNRKGSGMSAKKFITNDLDLTDIIGSGQQSDFNIYSFADPSSELQSYFGRANVNINNQFLLTATVRADGSSKFGENNKYGVFPSFAAAWNMSEAGFLPEVINSMKLRLGWGQTGNQEFPAGAAQGRYSLGQNGTLGLENVANPDLKWETSSTVNVGVDFIIANKLSGSIDYFNKTTSDLLFNFETTQPAPAGRYWINLPGTVNNSGVELALEAYVIDNADMSLSIGGNVTFMNNTLNGYDGPDVLTGNLFGQGSSGAFVQRYQNGSPLNAFYVREFNQIGDNGLSQLTDDGNSFFYIGNPNPDAVVGLYASFSYGAFDAQLNFNGAYGHQIYNNTKMSVIPIGNLGSRNVDASLIQGVSVQESTANPIQSSSRYLEPGDYMKLANMSLGYTIGNIGDALKNVRVTLTGQNLFVITQFSGFDPEVNTVNTRDGVPSFGIEYIPYPSARTLLIGVSCSL